MAGHGGAGEFKDLVVFLAAAGVVVPLFSRLKISPVLGFLSAGALLGPHGLGQMSDAQPWLTWITINDPTQIAQLSELGVAFLLFMIGLELSWDRLKAMRRLVFGLGLMQVVVCAVVLGGAFTLMGQSLAGAAVLGMGLALSSTAVVMPVMAERGRLKGAAGRSTFAVLLAQDLAVAPILVTVSLLVAAATPGNLAGDVLEPARIGQTLFALAPAALGLALVVMVGRLVLRPLFRSVARSRKRTHSGQELFVALCLLIVIGAGVAAQAAGLSMSIGALIAGVMIAETEYRREVELNIEPFKGLLLGVFFVGVGINLDLGAVAADPVLVFGLALMLMVIKSVLIFGLARLWGLSRRTAIETALMLGPAGEFAFVILTTGMMEGVAPPGFTSSVMLSATISMFAVPLLAMLGQRLSNKAPPAPDLAAEIAPPVVRDGAVLIVGYGRVGRLVGEMLSEHKVAFLALDTDPAAVSAARKDGHEIYYGDAGRSEMLELCGIATARALVVTMDAPGKVDEVVIAARALSADMTLIARARDDRHAARLYSLGVTDAVPETTEASLQLAENTLVDVGIPMGLVLASIHEKRDEFRALFQAAVPADRRHRPTRALRGSIHSSSSSK